MQIHREDFLQKASIVTCFNEQTIGTKVPEPYQEKFLYELWKKISNFDFAGQRVPGQGVIELPEAIPYISAGVGLRTQDPNDYHPVLYRGNVELYLKREHASPVEKCFAIVYTREAYLNDPDVKADEMESLWIHDSNCTHVLVAVLGLAGPTAPLSPHRLIANLAGGNNEALQWSADEIRAKASESKAYWEEWCLVAD